MENSINPDRIEALAKELAQLGREMEEQQRILDNKVNSALSSASSYNEAYVRSAVSRTRDTQTKVHNQARAISAELSSKSRSVRNAAQEYRRSEDRINRILTMKEHTLGSSRNTPAGKSILQVRGEFVGGLEGTFANSWGWSPEMSRAGSSFVGATLGSDTVFGGYIGTGIPAIADWKADKIQYPRIKGSLKGGKAARAALAVKAAPYRAVSTVFKNEAAAASGLGKLSVASKSLGSKLGVAGAVLDGGFNIYSDLNNEEYTENQKAMAITVHGVAMGASVAAVVLVCAFVPGPGWAIGAGIILSTFINFSADYAIDTCVEGK